MAFPDGAFIALRKSADGGSASDFPNGVDAPKCPLIVNSRRGVQSHHFDTLSLASHYQAGMTYDDGNYEAAMLLRSSLHGCR